MNHSATHAYQQALSDATDALKAAHEQLARSANVLARERSELAALHRAELTTGGNS